MSRERFLNREEPPSESTIRGRIGKEVQPVWDDVRNYLETGFSDYQPEMIFYNDQEGWAFRYRKGLQHLCTLFPEQGAFTALVPLSPEEDQKALEMMDYYNARIRDLLSRPSALPQGRWLWLPLEDHTDFVGLKLLLEIKNA